MTHDPKEFIAQARGRCEGADRYADTAGHHPLDISAGDRAYGDLEDLALAGESPHDTAERMMYVGIEAIHDLPTALAMLRAFYRELASIRELTRGTRHSAAATLALDSLETAMEQAMAREDGDRGRT